MIKPHLDKRSSTYKRAVALAKAGGWEPKWILSEQDVMAVIDHGCWFDEAAGYRVIEWFKRFLRLWEGRWAGKPFELFPWQRDHVIMPLFGWKTPEGFRRHHLAFVEVAKKNGKSPLAAAIAIYLTIADHEPGAQVICAANDRDQSKIVYGHALNMIEHNKALQNHIHTRENPKELIWTKNHSKLSPISKEFKKQEGLNLHGLIYDEFHAVTDGRLWSTLKYAGASREQPLFVIITTAGESLNSLWGEEHNYAESVLKGTVTNYRYHPFVCCNPEDADYTDPQVWKNANPSIGYSVSLKELRETCESVKTKPRDLADYKRYRCNIPCESEDKAIAPADWKACKREIDWKELEGRVCFGGLDLSDVNDLTCSGFVFPPLGNWSISAEEELDEEQPKQKRLSEYNPETDWLIFTHFFLPENNIRDLEVQHQMPYRAWAEQGLITLTRAFGGNSVDLDAVRSKINEFGERFKIAEIGYDSWRATEISRNLEKDGFEMVEVRQGFGSLAQASDNFERLIRQGRLIHDGHPIMTWMVGNLVWRYDENKNKCPSKRRSVKKIDGPVAVINGLARIEAQEVQGVISYESGSIFL